MSAMQPPSPERAGSDAPLGLLAALPLDRFRKPALAYTRRRPCGRCRSRLRRPAAELRERGDNRCRYRSGVTAAGAGDDPGKLARLVEGRGHRLVAHDREARPRALPARPEDEGGWASRWSRSRCRRPARLRRRSSPRRTDRRAPGSSPIGLGRRRSERAGIAARTRPATSSISRSISAARRCTAPMKRPGPAADQSHPDPPHRSRPPRRLTSPGRAASPCGPWQAPGVSLQLRSRRLCSRHCRPRSGRPCQGRCGECSGSHRGPAW